MQAENVHYLTTSQVLEDYVNLVTHIKQTLPKAEGATQETTAAKIRFARIWLEYSEFVNLRAFVRALGIVQLD